MRSTCLALAGYAVAVLNVSIVIPAYNEARRLNDTLSTVSGFLERWPHTTELIVVNDGSRDGTMAILQGSAAAAVSGLRVLVNERNLGKGAAVRRGVLASRGEYVFFMDADLSVPIDELGPAVDTMVAHGHRILIGSRRARGARIVRRQPLLRECLGHGFTYLARILLSREILDFTCGFKGFQRDTAQLIFSLQRRHDWGFDAEILYLARLLGIPVHQHPVRWEHRPGSRVRFPRDLWRSFVALLEIRLRVPQFVRRHATASSFPEQTTSL